MTILGIETSTAVCSVGLTNEFGLRSERSLIESHIHSEKLLTLIQELCDEQKMKLLQVDGVAISIGPGSFTGLRIGLSTAKGLCCALEKPLLAVPTFASIAKSVTLSHSECARVVVCIDAKQREYYIGAYEQNNGTVREVLPVHIGNLSSALAAASLKTIIVTDHIDEVKTESGDSIIVEEVFSYCRGDIIARMAIESWNTRKEYVWERLEPTYLKDFVVHAQMKLVK
ncbi:MAG: tRNA (adenosine(37)-N6)-threonylcarbamoyltransferase complex dimerization subunit type 1 TsaB [Bacteroidota bacterium]|jgi:tRNA threonylcarbamoyladenosine biosynthesis protein TsaB